MIVFGLNIQSAEANSVIRLISEDEIAPNTLSISSRQNEKIMQNLKV
jgi:hypothetical protein